VAQKVSDLARERIGGLQGLSAEPLKPRVTVIGHRWDTETSDIRRFLGRNQISFDWMTPEDFGAANIVESLDSVVTLGAVVRLADGQVIARPRIRDLAHRLGLQTRPSAADYDVAIVGGGPAGLAAAVYGASEGLRTIVVEREGPGGQASTSSRIENYLGFPSGISGDELASRALQQARRLGAEIVVTRAVSGIDPAAHMVSLDGGDTVIARTLIVATGVSWRQLAIDGFESLIGKGIYYGATRGEAISTHGSNVYLIGAGNSAGQAALSFAAHARSVTLLVRGDSLGRSMSHYLIEQLKKKANISVRLQSEVREVRGDDHLSEIEVLDRTDGTLHLLECGGLFVFIGADAETDWLPAEISRDARGYLLTGDAVFRGGNWALDRDPYLLETSSPGVFACGDVRLSPIKRVASAVGEGSMAIAFVHQYLANA
jgi:thioredoxin reductase (NADPH)